MRSRLPEMAILSVANYAKALESPRYRLLKPRSKHQELIRGARRLEGVLAIGNYLFHAIARIESNWRAEVLDGRTPYDPNEDRSIGEMYAQWSAPCQRCLREVRRFRGFVIRGSKEFARHCDEVGEILSGVRKPFEDPDRLARWEQIVASSRPNPRPIRIDDQGRIFELSGSRFTMRGLEPEVILQGLADAEAGRLIPLSRIIAERK